MFIEFIQSSRCLIIVYDNCELKEKKFFLSFWHKFCEV
nr:MAG TPA: hypothetical protein [Microviridae sp.]